MYYINTVHVYTKETCNSPNTLPHYSFKRLPLSVNYTNQLSILSQILQMKMESDLLKCFPVLKIILQNVIHEIVCTSVMVDRNICLYAPSEL